MNKTTLIIFILILSTSGIKDIKGDDGFRRPFNTGDYFEFRFTNLPVDSVRYSAKVVSDTLIDNYFISTVEVYNEPGLGNYTITYKLDTNNLYLYGGNIGCADTNGNLLILGFNMPIGYIWNTCNDTTGGIFFRSRITDTTTFQNGLFGSGDPLKAIYRKDTAGVPIEGITQYVYSEMFGFLYFFRDYGSPTGGGPYEKIIMGAIIDSVRYGSLILGIQQISNEIPSKYSLKQNYPNPFNPSTKISFSIIKSEFTSLKIYDELGREVDELVNKKLSPGVYEYDFVSRNLPSGVYYYRIQSGNFIDTKKMILVK